MMIVDRGETTQSTDDNFDSHCDHTPNRARSAQAHHAGPPAYEQHVREWTAGELYWVLRCFYRDVRLLAMPDPFVPWLEPADVDTTRAQLVADCRDPLRSKA